MKVKNVVVAAFVLVTTTFGARAQGTTFTYQGQLSSGGNAANGSFDLQFGLYTNVSTGNLIGSLETNTAIGVTNGLFTTALNFGNVFNGSNYWLEIGVRTNGSTGTFTTLSPRQPITPTPYAITASNLTGTLPATQLTGTLPAAVVSGAFSNSVSFTNSSNVFVGNGSGLTNVPIVTQSNYLYVFDTTTQLMGTANLYQGITINSAGSNAGWLSTGSGIFTPTQSGLYLVNYQAHFENASSSGQTVAVRAMLNIVTAPAEINSSEGVLSLPAGGFLGEVSRSFLLSISAGQTISFQMTTTSAGSSGAFLVSGTFDGQTFPSIAMTITRIQ